MDIIALQGKSGRKIWLGQVIKSTLEKDSFSWSPSFDAEDMNWCFYSLACFTSSLCLKHKWTISEFLAFHTIVLVEIHSEEKKYLYIYDSCC